MSESRMSPRKVQAAINRAEAVRLRVEGQSLRSIAEALDLSVSTVHEAIDTELRKLAESTREDAAVVREIEDQRLDGLVAGLWPKATTGDVKAADCLIRVSERRSKLWGLDQPTRVENTTRLSVDSLTDIELLDQARLLGIPIPTEFEKSIRLPALEYNPDHDRAG